MNLENIHNYYEKLVRDYLLLNNISGDQDFLEDVACVALNRLPARYVRFDIDMAFYMTDQERQNLDNQVDAAVKSAVEFVERHRAQRAG